MEYTVEGLERSRNIGFRQGDILGLVLKVFLNLSNDLRILDLGCGSGFFTRIIAKQCNAEIIGVDINERLLDGARKLAKKEGLNIIYEVGDIRNIGDKDNSFDIVMCDVVLERFQVITTPLSEMKKVCKDGGIVVAIEPFYQSFIEYYPETDNETRNLLLKFSRADRNFGLGPMLPESFNSVGLKNIDFVTWFWGDIGYKILEFETKEEKLQFMEENLKRIKKFLPDSKQLQKEEQLKIIQFYEERLKFYKENPEKLNRDMSVRGMPVFIVKGYKK
ncbi:class I SAM-dependent methyltransferase [candidate division WOR-3 bacterium]|nr:class I SAM-dependent methyltransferase [candidate division WOR-3 bacterium]